MWIISMHTSHNCRWQTREQPERWRLNHCRTRSEWLEMVDHSFIFVGSILSAASILSLLSMLMHFSSFSIFHSLMQQCGETAYCELNMSGNSVVLKKGEYAVDPTNPCNKYKCIVSSASITHCIVNCLHWHFSAVLYRYPTFFLFPWSAGTWSDPNWDCRLRRY